MPLSLPDDDSGPIIPGTKVTSSQGRKVRKPTKTQKRQPKTSAVAGGLPSDDEGPQLEAITTGSCGSAVGSTSSGMDPGSGSDMLYKYDDETLKLAARKIPSETEHPFDDLREYLTNLPPVSDPAMQCTVWEVFSLPRLQPVIVSLGGKCRRSFDIRHFWDLGQEELQRVLFQDVASLQPRSLMLSPPCTWVSMLQHSNWSRIAKDKRVMNLLQALRLIDLAMWLADHQVINGYIFAFEHPAGSLAWERNSVAQLHLSSVI